MKKRLNNKIRSCCIFLFIFNLLISSSLTSLASDTEGFFSLNQNVSGVSGFAASVGCKIISIDGAECLETDTNSVANWNVNINNAGSYLIEVSYYPLKGKGTPIERNVLINSEQQFSGSVFFERIWQNESNEIKTDSLGNQIRPNQVETIMLTKKIICYNSYVSNEEIHYNFKQGINTISFIAISEPMAIKEIRVFSDENPLNYSEYIAQYNKVNKDIEPIIIEGEAAVYKSSYSLYPLSDRTSSNTTPFSMQNDLLNCIGGKNWSQIGQWIKWNFEVNKTGLYSICLRVKQDFGEGSIVSRTLLIDDKVPVKELEHIGFQNDFKWQSKEIMSDNKPLLIYLEEGKHTLTLKSCMGDMAPLVKQGDKIRNELMDIYRKVFVITGESPDENRDYFLEDSISGLRDSFKNCLNEIRDLENNLLKTTKMKGSNYSQMQKIELQLEKFSRNPELISKSLDFFRMNISALSSWLLSAVSQPLLLDKIVLAPENFNYYEKNESFFSKIVFGLNRFIYTFFRPYNDIGSNKQVKSEVTLWVGMGRDQALSLRNLVKSNFETKKDITVDVKLVDLSILLPAVASNKGPDLAIGLNSQDAMNYAYRGALKDLSSFEDFNDIKKQFFAESLKFFTYNDKTYALPETFVFPMMFYRTDILKRLGLTPPKTWQELYNLLSVLDNKNMNIGVPIPDTMDTYLMFLYQNGGQLYDNSLTKTAVSNENGISAFEEWTNLYTKYKLLQKYDLATVFRTGEMPIVITNYNFYALLTATCPEISGLWEFDKIPGKAVGNNIVNSSGSAATGTVMFKNAKDANATWEFLKWWTSVSGQVMYDSELETIMGTSGRIMTANIDALSQLPWNQTAYERIFSQAVSAKGYSEAPGSYLTTRYLNSAILLSVNNGINPRESLSLWSRLIDNEITQKRKEFHLN